MGMNIHRHVGIHIHVKILYLLLYGNSSGLFPDLNKPDIELHHLFPEEYIMNGTRLSMREA